MLVLACGFCADVEISRYLPFVPCLAVVFVAWCCWGLVASKKARNRGERLALSPKRYMITAIIVWVLTFPLTMGSFLAPMLLILPHWLLSLFRHPVVSGQAADTSAKVRSTWDEATARRVVLTMSVLLVPVCYAILLVRIWF